MQKTTTQQFRIGSLIPSSNTTQEREFLQILPPGVSLHTARMTLTHVQKDTTIKIVEALDDAVQSLMDADVDVILLGLTAPSSRLGIGYDLELKKRIEDKSGKPATTAATASIQALNLLNAKRISFLAPWTEEINEFSVAFIENNGFEVPVHKTLGYPKNLDIGRLDSSTAYKMAIENDRDDIDAVMLACGNWLCIDVVDQIEKELGKPVITTNQVSFWGALKLAGYDQKINGFGKLLSQHLID
jgi:maleate isomerase